MIEMGKDLLRPLYRRFRETIFSLRVAYKTLILEEDELNVKYDEAYYEDNKEKYFQDAEQFAKQIYGLFEPETLVSLGCGNAMYLSILRDQFDVLVQGVDGSQNAKETALISEETFRIHDLREPLNVEEPYDLALCIEVAEHIDEEHADTLVANCVSTSNVVVFTAAQPGQPGTDHVNLKPKRYWKEKFASHGYHHRDDHVKELTSELDVEKAYWLTENVMIFEKDA